ALAVGPWLDMTRSQEIRHGETSDGAAPLPEVEEPLAEQVLSDALDDEALGLGRPRQRSDLLLERVEELVRKCLRKLEGAPQEPVQRRHIGHDAPAGSTAGYGPGQRRAVVAECSGDVLLRERGGEEHAFESCEPHAQRALCA